jgi:hypothetical protein
MILTSPSEDTDQTPPVTTTFDAPGVAQSPRRTRSSRRDHGFQGVQGARVDWDRMDRLHFFVRARTLQRLREAELHHDYAAQRTEREGLHAIEAMSDQAHRDSLIAACAITFFRARAMRDADHPDFLGEWIGAQHHETKSA